MRLLRIIRKFFWQEDRIIIRGNRKFVRFVGKPRIQGIVTFDVSMGGIIEIGTDCVFFNGVMVETHGGNIFIGNRCSFNPYTVIYGHGNLQIGDHVRVAAHTVIVPANHNFDDLSRPIFSQGLSKKGITIHSDVWIGAGVRILDGVTVGEGAVIAAGSVVTRDISAFTVNAGVPCKLIKKRV